MPNGPFYSTYLANLLLQSSYLINHAISAKDLLPLETSCLNSSQDILPLSNSFWLFRRTTAREIKSRWILFKSSCSEILNRMSTAIFNLESKISILAVFKSWRMVSIDKLGPLFSKREGTLWFFIVFWLWLICWLKIDLAATCIKMHRATARREDHWTPILIETEPESTSGLGVKLIEFTVFFKGVSCILHPNSEMRALTEFVSSDLGSWYPFEGNNGRCCVFQPNERSRERKKRSGMGFSLIARPAVSWIGMWTGGEFRVV